MADQGAEGLLSPYLRKKRIQAAIPYLEQNVLDIGCGSGALAEHIPAENYLGIDIDSLSLKIARQNFPLHNFDSVLPEHSKKFQTIVALAVIEHVKNPVDFLAAIAPYLAAEPSSKIIITTPHPSVAWVHYSGATLGLFSKHANEEHESLMNNAVLKQVGKQAGLSLSHYSRFLFGANQLAIFGKNKP